MHFVTFPYGALGQVWYLIVWISDLYLLPYFKFVDSLFGAAHIICWSFVVLAMRRSRDFHRGGGGGGGTTFACFVTIPCVPPTSQTFCPGRKR